jgi:hypothetical protein
MTEPSPYLFGCAAREATYFEPVSEAREEHNKTIQCLAVNNTLQISVLGTPYLGFVPQLQNAS